MFSAIIVFQTLILKFLTNPVNLYYGKSTIELHWREHLAKNRIVIIRYSDF